MKRIFVIKSNTACIEAIDAKSPASVGRLDVVLDFLVESLALPGGLARGDVTVYLVLSGCGEWVVEADGESLGTVPLTEGESALLLSKLRRLRLTFGELIMYLLRRGAMVYYLHENGVPIGKVRFNRGDLAFVVGDQVGLDKASESLLDELGVPRVSLGKLSYLAWYCPVIINYHLDTLFPESSREARGQWAKGSLT